MKLKIAILFFLFDFIFFSLSTVTSSTPVPTFGTLVSGNRAITFSRDPSNYIWILEIAPTPKGPYELCHEAKYIHGALYEFTPQPNHFYRLHGITNDGSYNYF